MRCTDQAPENDARPKCLAHKNLATAQLMGTQACEPIPTQGTMTVMRGRDRQRSPNSWMLYWALFKAVRQPPSRHGFWACALQLRPGQQVRY